MEVDGTTISIRLFWSNVYVSEDVLFVISLAAYSAMVRVKELVERGGWLGVEVGCGGCRLP